MAAVVAAAAAVDVAGAVAAAAFDWYWPADVPAMMNISKRTTNRPFGDIRLR